MNKLFQFLWRGRSATSSKYFPFFSMGDRLRLPPSAHAKEISKVCSYRSPWQKLYFSTRFSFFRNCWLLKEKNGKWKQRQSEKKHRETWIEFFFCIALHVICFNLIWIRGNQLILSDEFVSLIKVIISKRFFWEHDKPVICSLRAVTYGATNLEVKSPPETCYSTHLSKLRSGTTCKYEHDRRRT